MRRCALKKIFSAAVLLGYACFSLAATEAMAQGVYPASANMVSDVTAAGPGEYSYEQACAYPTQNVFADCCAPSCGPRWSFAGEAIALQRTTTRNQSLFRDVGMTFNLLNAADMQFPLEYGPKVGAIRHGVFGSEFDVEVAYFQVGDFESNRSVPGYSLMVSDVNSAFYALDSTARYRSGLYVGEVNVRWQWLDWLTLLSGFRMGELNEQYLALGTHSRQLVPISVDVHTYNHLYGYQLGADGEVFDWGSLRINALCKAGAFGNFASMDNTRVGPPGYNGSVSAINERVSFLGEVSLTATYAITQRLAFRATYQAMWLEGVALAPEQLATSNFGEGTAKVDLDGGVFYHGGGLGFEYRF
ncbi:MAG: hypothetical protein JW959_01850 [Pirellulales bacterium]|nr:hypothetical protein [Pirellulales bacterium]